MQRVLSNDLFDHFNRYLYFINVITYITFVWYINVAVSCCVLFALLVCTIYGYGTMKF